MELIQQEVLRNVQLVQQAVLDIVIKQMVNVHHAKQDMDLIQQQENVHNVQQVSIQLVEQQIVNHVPKENIVEQVLQVVQLVQMVNMHHQQEVVVVRRVQEVVMEIV